MATKKTPQKKPAPKTSPQKKTTPKKPVPTKKAPEAKAARKPASSPQPPPTDPKAKGLLLNARKRRETPAVFKIKNRKHTPIVFTLSDVKDIINARKTTPAPSEKPSESTHASASSTSKTQTKTKSENPKTKASVHSAASLADILGYAPKSGKIAAPALIDESKIDKKLMPHYRDLIKMRDQVRDGLDLHTKETLLRSTHEDSGNLSAYSQHMADVGTDTFDRDFALSLVSSEQELLAEIEAAIHRIVKGTYGVCEITGKPIKRERLRAVPFTRYSLEGQQELEKNRRRSVERSGAFVEATDDDTLALADEDSET